MAPLPNGNYIIRSVSAEKFVGRHVIEDKSLLPKRILLLPDGIQAPVFEFRTDGNGTEIRTKGTHTADIDGLLFGVFHDDPPAEKWIIEPVPQHGENKYIILTANKEKGWVLPEEEPETQLIVRPLISTKSLPPQYPPNQLWEIIPGY